MLDHLHFMAVLTARYRSTLWSRSLCTLLGSLALVWRTLLARSSPMLMRVAGLSIYGAIQSPYTDYVDGKAAKLVADVSSLLAFVQMWMGDFLIVRSHPLEHVMPLNPFH